MYGRALVHVFRIGMRVRARVSMCAQVGNQDHSLMLGVECADNILFGAKVFLVVSMREGLGSSINDQGQAVCEPQLHVSLACSSHIL